MTPDKDNGWTELEYEHSISFKKGNISHLIEYSPSFSYVANIKNNNYIMFSFEEAFYIL